MYNEKPDKLSLELGKGIENIKIIKNFIPKNDIDLLVMYGWCFSDYKKNNNWPNGFLIPDKIKDLVLDYENRMIAAAEKFYNRKFEKDRSMDFSYREEGSFVEKHSDNIKSEKDFAKKINTDNLAWSGHLSIIGYLNDNFSGGEIYFPEQDFEYSPKAGDIIMFPGNIFYEHEVKKFHGEKRITMSIWTRFLDFTGEV